MTLQPHHLPLRELVDREDVPSLTRRLDEGLSSLLRLTSLTLLAFVLVVLSVNGAWRPAGPLGPALVFSQATVRLSWPTGQTRPLPTVSTPAARTRSVHLSSLWGDLRRNRFWFIGRTFQVEPAVPPHVPIIASPADGDASTNQPPVLRSVRAVHLRTPGLALMLALAFKAEALRCWNRRHVGAVVAGPVTRRALVRLVVGLVLFGTVMVALVVHHEVKPGGRVLPLVRVSPGTVELFSESTSNRPEGTVAEARTPLHPPPDGRGNWSDNPRRVLDVWFMTVDRVLMKHSRPIRPPPVNASDKRMWLRQVASDEHSRRLTLQPPFFAQMLVVAVGLLAMGREVIPAFGGRAGFRVEPKPTADRQKP